MIDLENEDIFGVTALTAAINEDQAVPGQLNNSGLFQEEGISTTTFQIEKDGMTLALVPSQTRGGPGKVVNGDKRIMLPFNTIHLPELASIMADEVQNVREFGTESGLQTVQGIVNKRLMKMRAQIDATIEHLKVGALKGLVLDADGSSTLLNIYTAFGISQSTFAMAINTAGTKMIDKCRELADELGDAMNGIPYSGIEVYCGRNFYNKFVSHGAVETAYNRWNDGQFLRGEGNNNAFTFGEIRFIKYRGNIGNYRFIGDNDAYAVPTGGAGFIGRYAPANYIETVNTVGLPYYAKLEAMPFGKGFAAEAQSNPIFLPTNPKGIFKLSMGS